MIAASVAINLLAVAFILQIYDRVLVQQNGHTLLLLIAGLVLVLVADAGLRLARAALGGWAGMRFEHEIGCRSVATMLGARQSDLESEPTGVDLERLVAIDRLRDFHTGPGLAIAVDLPFVVLFLGLIWAIATMALVWRLLSPLNLGLLSLARGEQIKQSLQRINQLMRLAPEAPGRRQPAVVREFAGRISFQRIALRYRPEAEPAAFGLSLEVGASGAGKSTVLKLLAGLYRPQAGAIAIDGIDIRQIDPLERRHAIAYVPQSCW